MKIKSLFYVLLFFFILKKGFVQQKNIKIPLIIDADTANEIDDLFAIVRAVGEPRFNLLGITAAQFNTSPYASKNSALESHDSLPCFSSIDDFYAFYFFQIFSCFESNI